MDDRPGAEASALRAYAEQGVEPEEERPRHRPGELQWGQLPSGGLGGPGLLVVRLPPEAAVRLLVDFLVAISALQVGKRGDAWEERTRLH